MTILHELREIGHGRTFVFPSTRGRIEAPIAKPTLNTAVKSLGLEMKHFVLYDFRRTASTHLHEMGLPSDAIEKALAHEIRGIKGVYNRAQYSDDRKRILQLWAPSWQLKSSSATTWSSVNSDK